MTLYVGLSGRIGSGKTVVSKHLQDEYGAIEHRFSNILEDVLKRLYIPIERETLQRLGKTIRIELGHDVLVKAMRGDLEKETADVVIVDGVRYKNEVSMLKGLKNSVLIFLSAPPEMRYERVVKRGTRGEASISFEEFTKNEKAATEKELEVVEQKVDYILENTGTIEDMLQKVDELMVSSQR